jgi:UDP-MurNAc hydroxylase
MHFTFIANACGIFTGSEGTKVLCDPWLIDGVFEGSWCHYPPLSTSPHELTNVDAIYLSHIHPDHFDERSLQFFDVKTPILVLKRQRNFLLSRLNALGYLNVVEFEDGITDSFREFKITMFAPFAKHNFHDAAVGNIIDSAMVIESGGLKALNANDNTPTPEVCALLRNQFGTIDLAMLNYNSAGPYPSCFDNLTDPEKDSEHRRILNRNFDYMCELLAVLTPRAVLPFAGAYVIGGPQAYKNRFLGTTSWDVCATEVLARRPNEKVCLLREGDTLDIFSLKNDKPYDPIDIDAQSNYISSVLKDLKYEWESDRPPSMDELLRDLETASSRMIERGAQFGIGVESTVIINLDGRDVKIAPLFDNSSKARTDSEQILICSLSPKLLRRILDRKAHWNNAEIGCHIDFFRSPNVYEPDLHTLLQFLHL